LRSYRHQGDRGLTSHRNGNGQHCVVTNYHDVGSVTQDGGSGEQVAKVWRPSPNRSYPDAWSTVQQKLKEGPHCANNRGSPPEKEIARAQKAARLVISKTPILPQSEPKPSRLEHKPRPGHFGKEAEVAAEPATEALTRARPVQLKVNKRRPRRLGSVKPQSRTDGSV